MIRLAMPSCLRLALLLPLLAACAQVPPETAPPEAGPAPAADEATAPAEVPPPPAAAPDPPPPAVPATLAGLAADEIERLLGSPSFRRRDPPAEIWQYRGAKCTLDLFLYDREGVRKVAHVAVRGQTAGEAECLKEQERGR